MDESKKAARYYESVTQEKPFEDRDKLFDDYFFYVKGLKDKKEVYNEELYKTMVYIRRIDLEGRVK